jgi:hypothetical protein
VYILSVDRWTEDVQSTNPFSPNDRNESSLLRSFKQWVPPPNPPPIIGEKDEATTHRVCNPPMCKCGYHSELANPPAGLD